MIQTTWDDPLYILGVNSSFATKIEFLSLKIILVFVNGVDLDRGLHCLPKFPFPFRGFQYTKGKSNLYFLWSYVH